MANGGTFAEVGGQNTLVNNMIIDFVGRAQGFFNTLDAASVGMQKFASFVFSWRGALTAGLAVVGFTLLSVGRKAIAMAATIDAALREVASLIPETVGQLSALRDRLIDLSTRLPERPELLTNAFYQVISAGITDTADAFKVLESAGQAAVAGLSTTETAVDAITTVLNAFQLSASESTRVSDVFFETVKVGKLRFEDLANVIGDVATSAALTGVSIEEASAALATLTQFGISAAESTTSLNRLLLAVVQATDEERRAAKQLGIDFSVTALQTKGLAGFINELNEATGGQVDLLSDLIPEIRAARAAFVLAGEKGAAVFQSNLAQIQNSAGATAEAFREVSDQLTIQLDLIRNKLNVAYLRLGNVVLPIVVSALRRVNDALEGSTERQIRLLRELGRELDALRLQREQDITFTRRQLRDLERELESTTSRIRTVIRTGLEFQLKPTVGTGGLRPQVPAVFPRQTADRIFAVVDRLQEGARSLGPGFEDATREARLLVAELESQADLTNRQREALLLISRFIDQVRASRGLLLAEEIRASQLTDRELQALQERQIGESELLRALRLRGDARDDEFQAAEEALATTEREIELRRLAIELEARRAALGVANLADARAQRDVLTEQVIETAKILVNEEALAAEAAERGKAVEDVRTQLTAENTARRELLEFVLALLEVEARIAGIQAANARRRGRQLVDAREVERAREELERLRRELELLERFDFVLFDDVPEPLSRVLRDILRLDEEIAALEETIKTAGDTTGDFTERLNALRRERQGLDVEARRLALTLEGRIADDAVRARERVQELVQTREILRSVGLDVFGELDEDVLAAAEAIGSLESEIVEIKRAIGTLDAAEQRLRTTQQQLAAEGRTEVAESYRRQADELANLTEKAREHVRVLRGQQTESRSALLLFDRFGPQLAELGEFAGDFAQRIAQEFGGVLPIIAAEIADGLAITKQAVDDAVAEVERLETEESLGVATAEQVRGSRERLRVVQERYNQSLVRLRRNLVILLGSEEAAAELMRELGLENSRTEAKASKLGEALGGVANIIDGILSAAAGLDILPEKLEDGLRAARALTDGLNAAFSAEKGLLSFAGVSGLAQATGGAIGLIGTVISLFSGTSAAEKARIKRLEDNTAALKKLGRDLDALRSFILGLPGDIVTGLRGFFDRLEIGTLPGGLPRLPGDFFGLLDEFGLTLEDLAKFAEEAGIEVKALNEAIGRGTVAVTQELVDELRLIEDAVRRIDLARALDTFSGQLELLELQFRLFDIEDPIKQLELVFALLRDRAGDLFRDITAGIDVTTEAGRRQFDAALKRIFEIIRAGGEDAFGLLGELRFGDFLDQLGNLDGLLDTIAENTGETRAFQVTRSITEVTGNRIVGALTTLSIIEQAQLAVLREILLELGGTLPTDTAVISFRAPGTELDILEIEAQQLKVLEAILLQLGGTLEVEPVTVRPPTQQQLDNFSPTPIPRGGGGAELLADSPAVFNFHFDTLKIDDPANVRARVVEMADEFDRELERRRRRRSRTLGVERVR